MFYFIPYATFGMLLGCPPSSLWKFSFTKFLHPKSTNIHAATYWFIYYQYFWLPWFFWLCYTLFPVLFILVSSWLNIFNLYVDVLFLFSLIQYSMLCVSETPLLRFVLYQFLVLHSVPESYFVFPFIYLTYIFSCEFTVMPFVCVTQRNMQP